MWLQILNIIKMDKKDKLEKYIEKYLHAKDLSVTHAQRSSYYRFNGRTVRVSDHVATNSDGDLSIIFDSRDTNHYIVHAATTGELSVVSYEECKMLLKSIAICPSLAILAGQKLKADKAGKEERAVIAATAANITNKATSTDTVFGIPKRFFTPGQIHSINMSIAGVIRKHGKGVLCINQDN